MRRFNYRATRRAALDDFRLTLWSFERLRTPSLVAATSLVILAMFWFAEQQRLHSLDLQLLATEGQLASVEAADEYVEHLEAEVATLGQRRDRLASWRRETRLAANEVAALGNALPPRAWLTAVQSTAPGSLSVSGRSAQIIDVGSALWSLQALDTSARAQLVSVTSDKRHRGVAFVMTLQHAP